MKRRSAAVLAALVLGASACSLPDGPPQARLWTLDDYIALYQGGGTAPNVKQLPDSLPIEKLLIDAHDGHYRLVISPSFEEDYPASYVTTDLWQAFDEIWVQPMYVLIKGWNTDGSPITYDASDDRGKPIFTVGPKSLFYSPYWETLYVTVPETSATRYRSQRDIANDRSLVITPGPGLTASLVTRTSIDGAEPDRELFPNLPPVQQIGPTALRRTGYLDGALIDYLDFGHGGFTWNTAKVVEELPLYELTLRDSDGKLKPIGGPKLGAAGPPFSGRRGGGMAPGNRPLYGAYWRLYNVELPPSARIIVPPKFTRFRAALAARGIPISDGPKAMKPNITADDVEKYLLGRVFLDPACEETYDLLINCVISTISRLESVVAPSAFIRTDLSVTCPFVSYNMLPVPNP